MMRVKSSYLVLVVMMLPIVAIAQPSIKIIRDNSVEIDGIYYYLNTSNNTACVSSGPLEQYNDGSLSHYWYGRLHNYTGDVVIPEFVIYDDVQYRVTSMEATSKSDFSDFACYGAFTDCKDLKSVSLPKSISIIADGVFKNCTGLINITIPNTVVKIGFGAFYGCGITTINLPDSLTFIDERCFYGCTGLTSVIIPGCVNAISKATFYLCTGLTSVTISSEVTDIGAGAFNRCSNLKDVYILGEKAPSVLDDWEWGNSFKKDDVKDAVLHVKDYAIETFKDIEPWKWFKEIATEKVTDFNLNYYVDGIVYKNEQHKYEDLITPETEPKKKGMVFSGWSEIPDCMPGKDVDVNGAFSWYETVNDNIIYQINDTIYNYATVIGNENVTGTVSIASYVDYDYTYKVATIADNAFNNRKDITDIVIPKGIITIGERSFANIDKLTDVTIYADDVPETNRTAFENSYINYATLHVPYISIEAYKSIGPWKDFKEIVPIEGTEPVYVESCAMPTISFMDGKLVFESETDGAECHYDIKVEDAKEGLGAEVTLSSTYEITAYASKEGYNDSDKNAATLYWVNVDPISSGVIDKEMRVNTNAIFVQNAGSVIAIYGIADGNDVAVYNILGQLIAQGTASRNSAEIDTDLSSGDICIIKVGDKSVKFLLR